VLHLCTTLYANVFIYYGDTSTFAKFSIAAVHRVGFVEEVVRLPTKAHSLGYLSVEVINV